MNLNSHNVAIGRGDGLVARRGDVVMYIAGVTGATALLRALDTAAEAESSARALTKALAIIALGPDSGSIPAFGMLAPNDDGFLLILRGHVEADVAGDGVSRSLTGVRALTWVDETVRGPVDRLVIGGGTVSGLTPFPHTALRDGVVPGGGFVVQAIGERVAPRSAAPGQPSEPAKPPERQRPPAPGSARAAAPTALRRPPPDRPIGAPDRNPADPTAAARPAIGALTVGDEAAYPLDRPYVIGRNPMIDGLVRDGLASPIFLPDEQQISRVHAYVTVDAGTVLVRDAGTPGGTYVAAPGDQTWTRVGDRPTEVQPGWCLRIGERILLYQRATPAQ